MKILPAVVANVTSGSLVVWSEIFVAPVDGQLGPNPISGTVCATNYAVLLKNGKRHLFQRVNEGIYIRWCGVSDGLIKKSSGQWLHITIFGSAGNENIIYSYL